MVRQELYVFAQRREGAKKVRAEAQRARRTKSLAKATLSVIARAVRKENTSAFSAPLREKALRAFA